MLAAMAIIVSTIFPSHTLDYREYHRKIDQAEILIMDSAYSDALDIYEKVFTEYPKGFSKDYYNAAICASFESKPHLFQKYVDKLLCLGSSMENLGSSIENLSRLGSVQRLLKKFNEISMTRRLSCDSEISRTFIKSIDSLSRADQSIRGPGAYETRMKAVLSVDSVNFVKLKRLIERYGFPNEDKIGMPKSVFGISPFYVILRHQYQNKNFDLSELLFEAVKNGDLLPEIFAELEDKKSNTLDRKWTYMSTMFYLVSGIMKEVPYDDEYLQELK
jgi:hypothetical protein